VISEESGKRVCREKRRSKERELRPIVERGSTERLKERREKLEEDRSGPRVEKRGLKRRAEISDFRNSLSRSVMISWNSKFEFSVAQNFCLFLRSTWYFFFFNLCCYLFW
jgi:hypothetical protein